MVLSINEKYEKLKQEFETYQSFAESTIQVLNEKNMEMSKRLDALTNIVEISKYINSNISDENLIPMINDMIIGILGVSYSTILLYEDNILLPKATNKISDENYQKICPFSKLYNGEPFVINSREPLFSKDNKDFSIHSLIGVPIYLGKEFKGYIIVEHNLYNFFNYDHITFISSIANQIGIALENNFLYKKVKDSSIKDPLLPIYNRKYFFDTIEEKIKVDGNKEFGIVMIDIDNFKNINDYFGHQFGDIVLVETIKIISENIEEKDIIARYGGEEIVIYIDEVLDKEKVFKKIDNIRKEIEKNIVKYGKYSKSITASFGLSYYKKDGMTLEEVLNKADKLCYKAKNTGKNQVLCN